MHIPATTPLLAFLLLDATSATAEGRSTTSFEALRAKGVIGTTIIGTGGYQGECLTMQVRNLSRDSVNTTIPPGWVFVSEDTTLQDILIVRQEVVRLGAQGSATIVCRGFCCESSMGAPMKGAAFRAGHQASTELTELAGFIANGRYPDEAVQSAIWVISDHHDISSIADDATASVTALRNKVSELTGIPVPWYSTHYSQRPGLVFSREPQRIQGKVDFHVQNNTTLDINVKNAEGTTVYTLGKERAIDPGTYTIDVVITVKGWPPGTYTICFYTDGNTLVRKVDFTVRA